MVSVRLFCLSAHPKRESKAQSVKGLPARDAREFCWRKQFSTQSKLPCAFDGQSRSPNIPKTKGRIGSLFKVEGKVSPSIAWLYRNYTFCVGFIAVYSRRIRLRNICRFGKIEAQTSRPASYHGGMYSDCGKRPAEVVGHRPKPKNWRNNRVTVTVRQCGRDIVCNLSAATVFYFSKKFYITGQKLSCSGGLMTAEKSWESFSKWQNILPVWQLK